MNIAARYKMRGRVSGLSDYDLLREFNIAPGMEFGGTEDPSRVWTRMLAHEINVRGLKF